jgi:predicted GTPase
VPAVVAVSADEGYNFVDLVNTIVERLPDEKSSGSRAKCAMSTCRPRPKRPRSAAFGPR